jgi:hypothetical protein
MAKTLIGQRDNLFVQEPDSFASRILTSYSLPWTVTMRKLSIAIYLFVFSLLMTCNNTNVGSTQRVKSPTRTNSRDEIKRILDQFFSPTKGAKCFVWSDPEINAFLLVLQQPSGGIVANQAIPAKTKELESVLAEYCQIGHAPQKPNEPGSISLKNASKTWQMRKVMKSHLLTSLRARVLAYQKFTTLIQFNSPADADALPALSMDDYASMTLLLARLSEANRFVRVFPGLIKLFAKKHPSKPDGFFDVETFKEWFEKRLSADPHTGLFNFSEDLIWYESDPLRYLGLKDLLNTTPESNSNLAEIIHHASNAFVLRGRAPNEYSLRDAVKTILKQKGQPKLDDKSTQELIALLKTHREQDSSGTYFIDLTQIQHKLSRK